jgi:hypothetical protein
MQETCLETRTPAAAVVVARWEDVLSKPIAVANEDSPGAQLAREAVP